MPNRPNAGAGEGHSHAGWRTKSVPYLAENDENVADHDAPDANELQDRTPLTSRGAQDRLSHNAPIDRTGKESEKADGPEKERANNPQYQPDDRRQHQSARVDLIQRR